MQCVYAWQSPYMQHVNMTVACAQVLDDWLSSEQQRILRALNMLSTTGSRLLRGDPSNSL